MKTYVLNLPRNTQRKQSIIDQFLQFDVENFEFVDGVDASAIENLSEVFDKQEFEKNLNRPALIGEIGCYLGHGDIWKKIVKSGQPGIVLEDDVQIDANFKSVTSNLSNIFFDIIFLSRPVYNQGSESFTKTSNLSLIPLVKLDIVKHYWAGFAYVIHPDHARILLEKFLPMQDVLDAWHKSHTRKYFAISKPCVHHGDFSSSIGNRDISSPQFGNVDA